MEVGMPLLGDKKADKCIGEIVVKVNGDKAEFKRKGSKIAILKAFIALLLAVKEDPELAKIANDAIDIVEHHSFCIGKDELKGFLEFLTKKLRES